MVSPSYIIGGQTGQQGRRNLKQISTEVIEFIGIILQFFFYIAFTLGHKWGQLNSVSPAPNRFIMKSVVYDEI